MIRFVAGKFVLAGLWAALQVSQVLASEPGNQTSVVQTNFVDRWITNTAQVQMQLNRFVTEFHTNWTTRVRTNYVDVFATNLIARTLTNRFVLDLVETNFVQAYRTNLKTLNL